MLAQITDPALPGLIEQLVGSWTPYVAFVAPIFLGLLTSEQSRDAVKRALPVLTAAVISVASILSEDGMTWRTLIFRTPALWVVIESSFRVLSGVVSVVRNEDLSVNDVLVRSKGLIK